MTNGFTRNHHVSTAIPTIWKQFPLPGSFTEANQILEKAYT